MRLFVSVDIEGIAGIAHWDEALKGRPDHPGWPALMTAEALAAWEGARDAGAEAVTFRDAHQTGRNLDLSMLPEGPRVIRGWSGHPLKMLQGLDAGYGAVAMVGWHAAAADGGNPLSHTMTGRYARIALNGAPLSEYRLHVRLAAEIGVPVVFLSGDAAICAEARATNPAIVAVETKTGAGASVDTITPAAARTAIREGVARALGGDLAAHALPREDSYRLELSFDHHEKAYARSFYPGARLSDPVTITLEAGSIFDVARALGFV